MTKINGKVNNLKELLSLVQLEGKDPNGSTSYMIYTCILECKDGKISVKALAKSNTVLAFIEYKKIDVISEGEIPVGSIEEFISYLKRFENDDIVNVETTENKIKIFRENPKKTAYIPLTARENIDDSLRAEGVKDSLVQQEVGWKFRKTELETSIVVNSHFIKQVLDDGSVQGLNRTYPISIGDEVVCKVGDIKGGMIETIIPVENKVGEASSSFAAGIDNVFSNISGEVGVWLAEKGPMLVIKTDEKVDAKYIIAPLIEEEE